MTEEEPLAYRILRTLAETAWGDAGMSLPRLGKRLGQSASVLMRELTYLSDATLGTQRGPGWVRVLQEEGRWMAHITPEGLVVALELARDEADVEAIPTAQTDIP